VAEGEKDCQRENSNPTHGNERMRTRRAPIAETGGADEIDDGPVARERTSPERLRAQFVGLTQGKRRRDCKRDQDEEGPMALAVLAQERNKHWETERKNRPDPEVVRPKAQDIAVPGRHDPDGRADKPGREPNAALEKINRRQREHHPGENEPREIALDLVGLADQRDSSADAGDIQNRRALPPGRGTASAPQNENPKRDAERQRREGNRAADWPAEKIPIMRDEKDNPGSDQQRAQDRGEDESDPAR